MFVTNVIGQLLIDNELNNGSTFLDTSKLPFGTYIISIQTDNTTFVEKFIKSKK